MTDSYIRRRFYPRKLIAGGGLILFGIVIVALFQVIHVLPHVLLIAGMLAVPMGVLIALRAYGRECAQCCHEMAVSSFSIGGANKKAVQEALASHDPDRILALRTTAQPASLFTMLEVKCTYCPQCRSLAVLKVAGWKPALIAGAAVPQLLSQVLPHMKRNL